MTDRDKTKRPPTIAGDEERVAAGARYRRGANASDGAVVGEIEPGEEDSMAVIVGEDDTPVEIPAPSGRRRARKTLQQFADDTKAEIREMRAVLDSLRAELNAVTIKHHERVGEAITRTQIVEHQVKTLADLGESVDAINTLNELRTEVTALRLELLGANGANGKIGTLRADYERGVREMRSDVWGDEARKEGDPPVIKEARRGIWILRTLAALAIGVAGTAGYIVKDAIHQDGEVEAQILDDRAAIRSLQQQVQLLYSKLVISGVPQ